MKNHLSDRVGVALLAMLLVLAPALACCPAPPSGKPVVNADQTVVLIWDSTTKTEHLIRQASFKSDAEDFGFLVPSPTRPELNESGNEAFPYLRKLTEPEKKQVPRPANPGCGCAAAMTTSNRTMTKSAPDSVSVLEEKLVAGFNAAVLETKSVDALADWLKEHGYA